MKNTYVKLSLSILTLLISVTTVAEPKGSKNAVIYERTEMDPIEDASDARARSYKEFKRHMVNKSFCSEDGTVTFQFDEFGTLTASVLDDIYYKLIFTDQREFMYLHRYSAVTEDFIRSEGLIFFSYPNKITFRPNQLIFLEEPDTSLKEEYCN